MASYERLTARPLARYLDGGGTVAISVLDRKRLWGRSGMRCAICRMVLSPPDELGGSTILGEEAHIVAKSPDGPRGDSPLTEEQRDSYSNLILLCPTDHAKIDSQPYGPVEYSVEKLTEAKRQHEAAVLASGEVDRAAQIADEHWGALIDQLSEIMGWGTWMEDLSGIFDPNIKGLTGESYDRLEAAGRWIHGRIWPKSHDRIRRAIDQMKFVIAGFTSTFVMRSELWHSHTDFLRTAPFQLREWNPELYDRLHREYEEHIALLEDLIYELTRYGNRIAKLVREEIDPSFRFTEGMLMVMVGPDSSLSYATLRPEFTEAELVSGEPYSSLEHFKLDRSSRTISSKRALDGGPLVTEPSSAW